MRLPDDGIDVSESMLEAVNDDEALPLNDELSTAQPASLPELEPAIVTSPLYLPPDLNRSEWLRQTADLSGLHELFCQAAEAAAAGEIAPDAACQPLTEAAPPVPVADNREEDVHQTAPLSMLNIVTEPPAPASAGTKDFFKQAFQALPEAVFLTDEAGRISWANPAAGQLLGCREAQLLERRAAELFGSTAAAFVPGQLLALANDGMLEDWKVELRPEGGGTCRVVNFSCSLVRDKNGAANAVLAIMRAPRPAKERTKSPTPEAAPPAPEVAPPAPANKYSVAELVELVPDALLAIDSTGVLRRLNAFAANLFGYTCEELLGTHAVRLLPERLRDQWDEQYPFSLDNEQIAEQSVTQELYGLRRDGREFPLEITRRQIDEVLLCTVRDITARKQSEHAAEIREQQLRRHNQALGELSRSETWEQGGLKAALQEITEIAARALTCARVSIWLFNEQRTRSICQDLYEKNYDRHFTGTELTAKDYPAYFQALAADRVIAAREAHTDPRTSEFSGSYLMPLGISSLLTAPLRLLDRQIGVVCNEHTGEPRTWSPEDETFAGSVADFVARALAAEEHKQSETARRESETRFHTLTETAPDAIITIDEKSKIVYANPAAEQIFGYPLDQIRGGSLTTLMPEHMRHLHEAGLKRYTETGARRHNWGAIEMPGMHRQGYSFPLEISFAEFSKNGQRFFTGIARDITARKRAEAAAQRQSRQAELGADIGAALNLSESLSKILQRCAEALALRLHAVSVRLWTLSAETGLLEVQACCGKRPEAQQEQVKLGQRRIGQLAQERKPFFTDNIARELQLCEQEWAAQSGATAFAGYPLVVEDRLVGVLSLFTAEALAEDTSATLAAAADAIAQGIARKNSEDELAALLAREQELRRIAEENNKLKDEFLTTISHELRTPLTGIVGWIDLIRSGTLLDEAEVERALATIDHDARAQMKLVNDLLDASRVVTDKLVLERKPVELINILGSALDTVRPAIEAKNIRLQVLFEPWVGPFVGDEKRLQQVVWNLLSNSVKFTPSKGLIEVRLERYDDKALITVSDTGQGIKAEFLPHIFDRFRQQDGSTQRRHGGMGLGLSIVKHIVELHEGVIFAFSNGVGKGADFMITLPLAIGQETAKVKDALPVKPRPTATLSRPISTRPQTLAGVRVLVVDDEPGARELFGVVLRQYAADVRLAANAAEARALLEEWEPQVLVSDIGMPDEDGYAMIRKIRQLAAERGGAIPAVALTAYASLQDRERALLAGFDHHLSKPVNPAELAAVVTHLVRLNEKSAALAGQPSGVLIEQIRQTNELLVEQVEGIEPENVLEF